MTTIFTHAITRDPGKGISNAISSKGLVPSFHIAKRQHNKYKLMLKSLGLAVYELKELPDLSLIHISEPTRRRGIGDWGYRLD